MWYFAWILGLGLALTFAILNALWNEFSEEAQECEDIDCDSETPAWRDNASAGPSA